MENHYLKNKFNLFYIIIFLSILVIGISNNAYSYTNPKQYDIIDISRTIRANEITLDNLQSYKQVLKIKKQTSMEHVKEYNNSIKRNIVAMFKLYYIPLQTLLFAYKTPMDLAISYSVLTYYSTHLKTEISNALSNIQVLNENEKKLNLVATDIKILNKQLANNKNTLLTYLKQNSHSKEVSDATIKARKLVLKSDTLVALMNQINSNNLTSAQVALNKVFAKNKGQLSWPILGYLNSSFHSKKSKKIYSDGISIVSTPKSPIVAPADGVIIFTEKFSDYDNLIIIKHAASYYSVISGRFSSFVFPTQLVSQDESIAVTDNSVSTIYYEFQINSDSVNPLSWLQNQKHQ